MDVIIILLAVLCVFLICLCVIQTCCPILQFAWVGLWIPCCIVKCKYTENEADIQRYNDTVSYKPENGVSTSLKSGNNTILEYSRKHFLCNCGNP